MAAGEEVDRRWDDIVNDMTYKTTLNLTVLSGTWSSIYKQLTL